MNKLYLVISSVFGVIYLVATFKLFFHSWSGYFQAWLYLGKPDILSALQGEQADDTFGELSLLLYHGGSVLVTFAFYKLLMNIFS